MGKIIITIFGEVCAVHAPFLITTLFIWIFQEWSIDEHEKQVNKFYIEKLHYLLHHNFIDSHFSPIEPHSIFIQIFTKKELKTKVPFVTWTYQIPKQSHTNPNPNKAYKLEVSVGQWYMFFSYPLASATLDVNVTCKFVFSYYFRSTTGFFLTILFFLFFFFLLCVQ